MFIKFKKYRDELKTQKKRKAYGAMASVRIIHDKLMQYKESQITSNGLRTIVLNELECEQFLTWLDEVDEYLESTIKIES